MYDYFSVDLESEFGKSTIIFVYTIDLESEFGKSSIIFCLYYRVRIWIWEEYEYFFVYTLDLEYEYGQSSIIFLLILFISCWWWLRWNWGAWMEGVEEVSGKRNTKIGG